MEPLQKKDDIQTHNNFSTGDSTGATSFVFLSRRSRKKLLRVARKSYNHNGTIDLTLHLLVPFEVYTTMHIKQFNWVPTANALSRIKQKPFPICSHFDRYANRQEAYKLIK